MPGMLSDLPNVLTLSRIAAVPVVVMLTALGGAAGDIAACALFVAAGITDYFDGKIARDRHMTSEFGRMLDPIADKLLVGGTLLMLAGTGRLGASGLYAALVILLRELLVSGLREHLASLRIALPVTPLAKWKTLVQCAAIAVLLAGSEATGLAATTTIGEALLWLAAALTLMTGWGYVVAGMRQVRAPIAATNAPGNRPA